MLPWAEARTACRYFGGDLATPTDVNELKEYINAKSGNTLTVCEQNNDGKRRKACRRSILFYCFFRVIKRRGRQRRSVFSCARFRCFIYFCMYSLHHFLFQLTCHLHTASVSVFIIVINTECCVSQNDLAILLNIQEINTSVPRAIRIIGQLNNSLITIGYYKN